MKEREFETVNEAITYLKNNVLPFLKRVGIRDGGQMVDAVSKIIKLLTGTESGMMELVKNLKAHMPAGEAQIEDMDKNKLIEIGDIVCVNFNDVAYTLCSKAIVVSTPVQASECWVFESKDFQEEGKIHYVGEGCTITLLEKGEPE